MGIRRIENVGEGAEVAKNYVYDFNAILGFFNNQNFGIDGVKDALRRYEGYIDARYSKLPKTAPIMTKFPCAEVLVDVRTTLEQLNAELDEVYQRRQSYVVAGLTYFNLMRSPGVNWDLQALQEYVERSLAFFARIDREEVDGEPLKADIASRMGITYEMYREAFEKLHGELKEVLRRIEQFKGQLRVVDDLLAEEERNRPKFPGYLC